LIVEFIARGDAMTQMLLRNRPDQYQDYNEEIFERLCGSRL
jgi:hypothetical protein